MITLFIGINFNWDIHERGMNPFFVNVISLSKTIFGFAPIYRRNDHKDLYMRMLPMNTSRRFYINIAQVIVKEIANTLVAAYE